MEERLGNEVLKSLFQYSDDGFIVVDRNGIVLEINEQYASYFSKSRDEIIGHPIEETISTTSMYDVMENGLIDSREDVYLQPYSGEDLRHENEMQLVEDIRIPALRFYQKGVYYKTMVTPFGEMGIDKYVSKSSKRYVILSNANEPEHWVNADETDETDWVTYESRKGLLLHPHSQI